MGLSLSTDLLLGLLLGVLGLLCFQQITRITGRYRGCFAVVGLIIILALIGLTLRG